MTKDKFFLILLLLSLPFQLNKYFPFDLGIVNGIRIDYLTPALYLSDIFLVLTIIFWLKREFHQLRLKKTSKFLLLALILFVLNLSVAINRELVVIKIVKLIELSLLFVYIRKEKISPQLVIKCLLIGGLVSAVVAVGQFAKQASLGGIFYWLGERYFNLQTPGVAKAVIFGKLILRPYGAFPHPNVLAGFLSLVLLSTTIFLKKRPVTTLFFQLLLFAALLLTMSRMTILTYLISLTSLLVFWQRIKYIKLKLLLSCLLITITGLVLFKDMTIGRFTSIASSAEQTIVLRSELFKSALRTFFQQPTFGVGFNNSLIYTRTSQPVHNLYLLIAVESGFVGLTFLLYVTIKIASNLFRQKTPFGILFNVIFVHILILSFFDHYFYTLHQGQLIFTIFMGLSARKKL